MVRTQSEIYTSIMLNLRMGEEAAYMLGHLYKAQDDEDPGQGFIVIGEALKLLQHTVTELAKL